MSNEPTSIGIRIPTKTINSSLPWLLAAMTGIGLGGGGSQFFDVLGAKEWKAEHEEALRQAEKDKESIVALKAQNAQLLELVGARFECEYE